jgi:hypothetical protein
MCDCVVVALFESREVNVWWMVMDWEFEPITAGQGLGYVSGPDFGAS